MRVGHGRSCSFGTKLAPNGYRGWIRLAPLSVRSFRGPRGRTLELKLGESMLVGFSVECAVSQRTVAKDRLTTAEDLRQSVVLRR